MDGQPFSRPTLVTGQSVLSTFCPRSKRSAIVVAHTNLTVLLGLCMTRRRDYLSLRVPCLALKS